MSEVIKVPDKKGASKLSMGAFELRSEHRPGRCRRAARGRGRAVVRALNRSNAEDVQRWRLTEDGSFC